jgi:L-alanine-DL-glutamate epimerase-like enolase superfamily enzyme
MDITATNSDFEREPLVGAFGFKGRYTSELWQSVAFMRDGAGNGGVGLGTQSVLWSDAEVHASFSAAAGNALMYAISEFALKLSVGSKAATPIELQESMIDEVHDYGKRITGRENLRRTFVLNAMVCVDNAAWMLYAAQNEIEAFDEMVPPDYAAGLATRHTSLAGIPLIGYGVSIEQVIRLVEDGYFLLKIKIGADPDQDGDPERMLAWDQRRISEIHSAVGDLEPGHAADGRVLYYLDANGRYDTKDRLRRLLDHAASIGALERIVLLEEPFPEASEIGVGDLGVTVAADESIHGVADVTRRVQQGYGAMALKPIAKTLSMTLKVLNAARSAGVPCFCADLTVNPILVDWNKNVAARLAPLPGMNIGVLESNGAQNYRQWNELMSYHPCRGGDWIDVRNGEFHLGEDFYRRSGGIFETPEHYRNLVCSS